MGDFPLRGQWYGHWVLKFLWKNCLVSRETSRMASLFLCLVADLGKIMLGPRHHGQCQNPGPVTSEILNFGFHKRTTYTLGSGIDHSSIDQ